MLTPATVKGARPKARPYKIFDGGGLFLLVLPSGTRSWRMKCRHGGRELLLTFGLWPDIELGEARERRDQVHQLIDRGVDPRGARGTRREPVTFEDLGRRWYERRRDRWSPAHAADVLASLERDVFPAIGAASPASIEAEQLLELLLGVEARGRIETARRLRERIAGIFRLGRSLKLCRDNPAEEIADELSPRPLARPMPALTELGEVRALLEETHDWTDGSPIVKLASRFLALTVPRMAALRGARRDEIEGLDGPAPTWTIPPARMKLAKVKKGDEASAFVVPLSRQAVDVARLAMLLRPESELLFPGRIAGQPIGEGVIGELYDRAGYAGRHVPHGWRAAFSTILNERFPEDQQLIDQALAHAGKGKVEAAYNRAQLLDRRRELMQRWADLITPIVPRLPAPAA